MNNLEKTKDLSYMNEKQVEEFRKKTISLINSNEWFYFFTLTFKHQVKCRIQASGIVEKFINVLSAIAFGSRSKKRVNCFPVIEYHKSGLLHVHILLENIASRITNKKKAQDFHLPEKVHEAWMHCSSKTASPLKSVAVGNRWFCKIDDIGGLANYITKEMEQKINPVLIEQININGRRI